MKKILMVLALLINCLAIKAQSDIPYYTQPNLLKFEGEYVYDDGNSSLKVLLKVEKTFIKGPKPFYIDNIIGYHVYTKHNAIIQNSIGGNKTISIGGFEDGNNKNKIKFMFTDLGRTPGSMAPIERGSLELLSDTTAKWVIRPGEGIRIEGPGIKKEDYGIYIPTNLILKKVN